jgi:hypothetical protein
VERRLDSERFYGKISLHSVRGEQVLEGSEAMLDAGRWWKSLRPFLILSSRRFTEVVSIDRAALVQSGLDEFREMLFETFRPTKMFRHGSKRKAILRDVDSSAPARQGAAQKSERRIIRLRPNPLRTQQL